MSYHSLGFLLFSVVVIAMYYLVGERRQKCILMIANFCFYFISGFKYLLFVVITTIVTYFLALRISKLYVIHSVPLSDTGLSAPNTCDEIRKKAKKYLLLGLVFLIGTLALCKYAAFVISNLNTVFSLFSNLQIPLFELIVPIGISFYTFMAISYLVDVYRCKYRAEQDFVSFAAYLLYFPHVVQGPIDRFDKIKAQMEQGVKLSYKNITFGAQLVVWGFFKKMVIADRLDVFVSSIYDNWSEYTGAILILATVVYSIQLYADFSGCIDIVSGISEMLGIKLDKNFRQPYFSKTMPEFWKRWHISLGSFFRDYVYIPLGGSRTTKGRRIVNILVVWILTGIWHGAEWKYVAWGMFHAVLIILSTVFKDTNKKLTQLLRIDVNTFDWKLFQIVRTFTLSCISRVFFRASGLTAALGILTNFFKDFNISALLDGRILNYGLSGKDIIVAIVSIIVLFVVDVLQEHTCVREQLAKQNIAFRWIVYLSGIFSIILFGVYGSLSSSSFIYFQF